MKITKPKGFIILLKNNKELYIFTSLKGGYTKNKDWRFSSKVVSLIEAPVSNSKSFTFKDDVGYTFEVDMLSEGRVGAYDTGVLNSILSDKSYEEISLKELLTVLPFVSNLDDSKLSYDVVGGLSCLED